jgi:glutamyl-tRNA reductase
VARNLSVREAEAARARTLIEEEVRRFSDWVASLDVVPTISALRELGDGVVEQVLRENAGRWESLSDADRSRLELLARAIVNRLLHEPTLRMKALGESGDGAYVYVQALRELFGLDPGLATTSAEPAAEQPASAEVTSLEARRRRPRSG